MRIARQHPVRTTRSVCCYCGVGCGVLIESEGDRIIGVRQAA
jgi:assimilatory nitrate reductase catalytic subunit